MSRRDFLMSAKVYDPNRHRVGGWYLSEKLDGSRCFWDGGISRGMPTVKIPWAGIIDPRNGQIKKSIKKESTGLWSRYGNPIVAPDWWLNTLPCCPLDGELWAGRGNYQLSPSIASKHEPEGNGEEWQNMQLGVFSTPHFRAVMEDGEIRNPNQRTDIRQENFQRWTRTINPEMYRDWINLETSSGNGTCKFATELANLTDWIDSTSETVFLIRHIKLPTDNEEAAAVVVDKLREVINGGGEGLVLRNPESIWTPRKVDGVLKVKASLDDEGIVVGFTSGRKTTKGSKHLGKIGALILNYNGQRLELSGMTDEEREFLTEEMSRYAGDFPGEDMPRNFQGKHFKPGDRVTFAYRELTDGGIPKEARLLRIRNNLEA